MSRACPQIRQVPYVNGTPNFGPLLKQGCIQLHLLKILQNEQNPHKAYYYVFAASCYKSIDEYFTAEIMGTSEEKSWYCDHSLSPSEPLSFARAKCDSIEDFPMLNFPRNCRVFKYRESDDVKAEYMIGVEYDKTFFAQISPCLSLPETTLFNYTGLKCIYNNFLLFKLFVCSANCLITALDSQKSKFTESLNSLHSACARTFAGFSQELKKIGFAVAECTFLVNPNGQVRIFPLKLTDEFDFRSRDLPSIGARALDEDTQSLSTKSDSATPFVRTQFWTVLASEMKSCSDKDHKALFSPLVINLPDEFSLPFLLTPYFVELTISSLAEKEGQAFKIDPQLESKIRAFHRTLNPYESPSASKRFLFKRYY
jgi:hypothetical protein